jgi:hypothetical protein
MDFDPVETSTSIQSDGIEPKFRLFFVMLNVNMWRLSTIACEKEESVRAALQYCGHKMCLQPSLM